MPTPSYKERPDLYDSFDGLPEGHSIDITLPPEIQKMIDEHEKRKQEAAQNKSVEGENAAPIAENRQTPRSSNGKVN